ncbi:MAG: hypothetical protein ACRDJ9_30155 [Dehalococcoidia bacterium]
MTAKQRNSRRTTRTEGGPITVPPQLRWAEALDRRAKEVIESILSDEEMMAQIRESIAEAERGEPAVPWRELQAKHRARRSGHHV